MDIIKVKITIADDIVTSLGIVKSRDPYLIDIPSMNKNLFDDYIRIQLQWNEHHQISEVDVIFDKFEDGVYCFNKTSSIRSGLERDYYRIDYKGVFNIKPVVDDNIQSLSRHLMNSSNVIKTSVANRVKQILPHESSSNQHILKFLLEIDTKLDMVVDLLSEKKEDVEFMTVEAVDVSGGGISFFSKEVFSEGTLIFLEARLDDTSNKVDFVAMGKIISHIKTDKGAIYSFEFENLDPEFSENIIKYVFEKERKQIQELKNR